MGHKMRTPVILESLDDYRFKIESVRTRILNILEKVSGLPRLQNKKVVSDHLNYLLNVVNQIETKIEDIEKLDEEVQSAFHQKDIDLFDFVLGHFEGIAYNSIQNYNPVLYYIQEFMKRLGGTQHYYEVVYTTNEGLKVVDLYTDSISLFQDFNAENYKSDYSEIIKRKKSHFFVIKIPVHLVENIFYWALIGHEIIHILYRSDFDLMQVNLISALYPIEKGTGVILGDAAITYKLGNFAEEWFCDGLSYLSLGEIYHKMLKNYVDMEQIKFKEERTEIRKLHRPIGSFSHPILTLRESFLELLKHGITEEEFFSRIKKEDISEFKDDDVNERIKEIFSEHFGSVWIKLQFNTYFSILKCNLIKIPDESIVKIVNDKLNSNRFNIFDPFDIGNDIFLLFKIFYKIFHEHRIDVERLLEKEKFDISEADALIMKYQIDLFRRTIIRILYKDAIIEEKMKSKKGYSRFNKDDYSYSDEPNRCKYLSITDLLHFIEKGLLIIDPVLDEKEQYNPTHIDLRLDTIFRIYEKVLKKSISADDKEEDSENIYSRLIEVSAQDGKIVIHPGQFILGQTFEYIKLPSDIVGFLDGRSVLGRNGIIVHATASSIDPGFQGHLTFEFFNIGEMPVVLYPLQRIGRITFYRLDKDSSLYHGKYRFSFTPTIKSMYKEDDLLAIRKISKQLEKQSSHQKESITFDEIMKRNE